MNNKIIIQQIVIQNLNNKNVNNKIIIQQTVIQKINNKFVDSENFAHSDFKSETAR